MKVQVSLEGATDTDRMEFAMQNLRDAVRVGVREPIRTKASKVFPEVMAGTDKPPELVHSLPEVLDGAPGPPPGRPDEAWREDPEYDMFAERQVKLPYSNIGATGHLLKGSVGAGLLAIAFGFKMSGFAVGIVSGVIIAIVCTHCARLLVQNTRRVCKRLRVPVLDFASAVEAAFLTAPACARKFARPCRFMVNFMLCFTYLGLPIIYIIVISSSVQQLVQYYLDVTLSVRYFILALVPFVMAMGLISELKWLVPFSLLSNGLFMVGFTITLYYVGRAAPDLGSVRQYGELMEYPLFLSTYIYGLENIGVVLPIENTMRHPEDLLSPCGVLNVSMVIIAGLYIVIGAAGYLAFGDLIEPNIIINLPLQEPAAQVVKVLIPIAILLSYGLQLYVVPLTLWGSLGLQHRLPQEKHKLGLILLRVAVVSLTVIVALIIPNLRPVLGLVGAVGFSTLGLLFPVLTDIVLTWPAGGDPVSWRWVLTLFKNILIVIFWAVALLAGSYSAILEIKEEYFDRPKL